MEAQQRISDSHTDNLDQPDFNQPASDEENLHRSFGDENKQRSFHFQRFLSSLSDFDDGSGRRSIASDTPFSRNPFLSEPGRLIVRVENGKGLDLEFDNTVHRAMRLQKNDCRVSMSEANLEERQHEFGRGGAQKKTDASDLAEEFGQTELFGIDGAIEVASLEFERTELLFSKYAIDATNLKIENLPPDNRRLRTASKPPSGKSTIPKSAWKGVFAKAKNMYATIQ